VIFEEGTKGDSLHLLRLGSVVLTRATDEGDILLKEVRAGQQIGQMVLMGDSTRRETARATVAAETVEVRRESFLAMVGQSEGHIDRLQTATSAAVKDNALMEVRPESTALMSFLMGEGLGEATDVLVIDESLCVGCDNCEIACAETHDGVSRLQRSAGKSFAGIHVPIACRHCEHPHCMKDCPPNAIHRELSGEVFIDRETCIGCGNCESNCPYDVIKMSYPAPKKPGLLSWMLFGAGSGPGEPESLESGAGGIKKAVKCDACVGQRGGPACVRACPTGAAIRVAPEDYINLMEA
jgi:Fe-S-cluster-containing hydrogenase component 2